MPFSCSPLPDGHVAQCRVLQPRPSPAGLPQARSSPTAAPAPGTFFSPPQLHLQGSPMSWCPHPANLPSLCPALPLARFWTFPALSRLLLNLLSAPFRVFLSPLMCCGHPAAVRKHRHGALLGWGFVCSPGTLFSPDPVFPGPHLFAP